jgi:hypothetical protein
MPGYSGGTAAADIARFRRMIAESGTATYTDSMLVTTISSYPLPDAGGNWPYLTSGSANTAWTPTYDLAHAAADIWEEKAAPLAGNFDFTADGATFHKRQVYENYVKEARRWRSRRAPGSHTATVYPRLPDDELWIGNLAEDD